MGQKINTPIHRVTEDGAPVYWAYRYGDKVEKVSGSKWEGTIVGFYSTDLTPCGYAVESAFHPGSVQIYPESALELVPDINTDDNEGEF